MDEFRTTSVRALIRRGDAILVEWFAPKGISFLPGGTVEPGEDLQDALVRELHEELDGPAAVVKQYLGSIGHRWETEAGSDSCLNHFFAVELSRTCTVAAREPGRELRWISINAPELTTLQPPSLRELVRAPHVQQVWDLLDSES